MAITFPTTLDSFTNPTSSTIRHATGGISPSATVTDLQDAVEALEAKVGVDSSAVATSHDYKLANLAVADITDLTATAAELNTLDGITATVDELNVLDGVTATTAELNILDGVTATTAELNILDGVTSTAAELNILDGVTATTTEINSLSVLDSDSLQVYIGKLMYPVGSIYINATNSTNPATLLGFGTWTAFGSGRVPVGYNSGDTDFNAGEKTGGSKTVNLQHSHTEGTLKAAIGAVNGDSAALGYQPVSAISGVSYTNNYGVDGVSPGAISNVNHATPVYGSTANSGSTAQTVVQPYITVYMWKRTA